VTPITRPIFSVATIAAVAAGLAVVPPSPATSAGTHLVVSPGRQSQIPLSSPYVNGRAAVSFTVPSASSTTSLAIVLRGPSRKGGYRARVNVAPSGRASLAISRVRAGHETVLTRSAIRFGVRPGRRLRIQGVVSGVSPVSIRATAWLVGSSAQAQQVAVVDRSPRRITSPGRAWAWASLSRAASHQVRVPFSGAVLHKSRPSLSSTGVPAGVPLRVHRGNITVRKAGTHLDRLDIRGFVTIKAPNVRITRSIVRGGTATYNRGMITNYGYRNLVVSDTDFLPSNDTVWQDGMKGSDFTLRRVYINRNVDSVKVQGSNVLVQDSLLGNTHYWAHDPNQHGGPTHNDGIQIQTGRHVRIVGNYIRSATNFAVLGASDIGNTIGLRLERNWLDGGHCTVKLEEQHGHSLSVVANGNRFGPRRIVNKCAVVAVKGTALSQRSNMYTPGNERVSVTWTNY
jgi:hypothetical protein